MNWFNNLVRKAVPLGTTAFWGQGSATWNTWSGEKAIAEGYKSSPWVYACVKKRADAVSSVPLKVQTFSKDGWEDAPQNHPLQQLINFPNPSLDRAEMMRLLVSHLDLAGNGYFIKVRAGSKGMPVELWPAMPDETQVVPAKEGSDMLIEQYKIGRTKKITYDQRDVVHVAYTNPSDLYYGMSPLQAAGKAVDIDNAAASWQKVSMQNRGIPDGVFQIDGELTSEQFEQARKQVAEQYSGIQNSRSPWVLGKAKWQAMSLTPAELDFMETRVFSMKQICAVYGVPYELVSGIGDSNRASSETVRKTFWLDTIIPLLDEIVTAMNMALSREFGQPSQIRIVYDLSSVPALQQNMTELISNAERLFRMGVSFNEINQKLELGFDDSPEGDIRFIQSGLLPIGTDFSNEDDEPTDDEAKSLSEMTYGKAT